MTAGIVHVTHLINLTPPGSEWQPSSRALLQRAAELAPEWKAPKDAATLMPRHEARCAAAKEAERKSNKKSEKKHTTKRTREEEEGDGDDDDDGDGDDYAAAVGSAPRRRSSSASSAAASSATETSVAVGLCRLNAVDP
jgi:hypothetical protein